MEAKKNIPVACFAPPLTDATLARYKALTDALPRGEVRDAMQSCYACVAAWWALPESTRTDGEIFRIRHKGKQRDLRITPLTGELVEALWDVTPYLYELNAMQAFLDDLLPTGTAEVAHEYATTTVGGAGTGITKSTRNEVVDPVAHELSNAARHLLWHAKEIALDREPLTNDKLPA
jgi:hypothetical protein